jgi:hypothetical protein
VESLLAREKQAEGFMEARALEALGKQVANELPLTGGEGKLTGSTLSQYRVIEKFGGGMAWSTRPRTCTYTLSWRPSFCLNMWRHARSG